MRTRIKQIGKAWLLVILGAALYHASLVITHKTWGDGYFQGRDAMLKRAQEYVASRLKECR